MIERWVKNPIVRKRISRFKEVKRAYISFWLMVILYTLSLGAELICNNNPLYLRFEGKSYFPIFRFYPESLFLKDGKKTRPNYKKLNNRLEFKNSPNNFMIFPPIPYGPFESIDPASISVSDHVTVVLKPMPLIGTVNIKKDGTISRTVSFEPFVKGRTIGLKGRYLNDYFNLPDAIQKGVRVRFANQKADRISVNAFSREGMAVRISLSTFRKRSRVPKTIRLTFKEAKPIITDGVKMVFNREREIIRDQSDPGYLQVWQQISGSDKDRLQGRIESRFLGPVDSVFIMIRGRRYEAVYFKQEVRFPYDPSKEHLMGIDGAGRDVFTRIIYGLRTSLTFGLLLVVCSMTLGIVAGSLQGYYGGILDITSQRFIEIWSALPFLYIMILMGSVYGRSFSLLLLCYGLFNWIGISYYIRAEFLRLRRQAFVEASKCMGVSAYKIIFKHILPNALVPVITFLPFSLVGAIGALAALDYLGFGLPPPTPSWGELLFQAQQYRWAWWLILYPSLALFTVMLLGVFVGEGIRNAYDPKRYTRLE
jgi:microcin C transport system permease protein